VSGSTFAVGTNAVVCSATDASGNGATCGFNVIVTDDEAPTITCPADLTLSADAGQSSRSSVTYAATASDNCPGVSSGCTPASGSTFAVGTNSVTCTATDASGNTASCSFTVTVLAFQITAITLEGNDIRVTWTSVGGQSYVLQGTDPNAPSGYSTNTFADASPVIAVPGVGESTTNYLDVG